MSFDIDFAQMPRLAALLDVLHNALGFASVEDLLEPILARGAPTPAGVPQPRDALIADRPRFEATFQRIYCSDGP